MKKLLAKIVCMMLVLALGVATLIGCSDSEWSAKVTLKNSGAVVSNGGFIAETENYIYFINGIGVSTSNNKMGQPLKGALMVADKNDLSKAEIVVPKLMTATDYNMGVFIDNGYAYYGTPNDEKNSAGLIANNQMTFMRTKLDGSGKTDEYFTLGSLSIQYRIVKAGNTVYIYYYENNALYCYDTVKQEKSTVIKMDVKDNKHKDDNDNYYTLDKLTLLNDVQNDGVVAYFTATVYVDKYNEDFAQNAGYERKVATYNQIYAVVAGNNTPELVKSGKRVPEKYNEKYQISLIDDGYIFYTNTVNSTTKNYAIKLSDARTNWATDGQEIVNQNYVKATNLFVSLDEVYVLGENVVYKTTAVEKDTTIREPILSMENVSRLLFIREEGGVNYLYYFNTLNNICKIDLETLEQEIRISDDSVATNWYVPEVITIGQGADAKDYIFYCDNSLFGKSYIEYVDLSADVDSKDTDEDDKEDLFFLKEEEIKELGKKTSADKAEIVGEKIKALEHPEDALGEDADEDAKFMEEYQKVLDEYNALGSAKDKVAYEQRQLLANIKKAKEVIEKYKELEGIEVCVDAEDAEELGFKDKYDAVKKYLQNFKNSSSREDVDVLISENLKANYTKALELFE